MDRDAIDTSHEAAQEYSPRRKPRIKSRPRLSPGGAEESFRIDNSWAAVFVVRANRSFAPVGLARSPLWTHGLRPGLHFRAPSRAQRPPPPFKFHPPCPPTS